MIDLKEFVRVLDVLDEGGLIFGGRFDQINEIFEHFTSVLKRSANLIFFCDLSEGRYQNIDQWMNSDYEFDRIKNHKSVKKYLEQREQQRMQKKMLNVPSSLRPNERLWHNMLKIAEKYGETVTMFDFESLQSAILTYGRTHRENTMALITRNTDYLAFDGDFQFWSLSDVDFVDLKIAKFCRRKLRESLELNTAQMQLLLVVSNLSFKDQNHICKTECTFFAQVRYVRQQDVRESKGFKVSKLTGQFTDELRLNVKQKLKNLKSINNKDCSNGEDIHSDTVTNLLNSDPDFKRLLHFCRDKIYFAYKLMNETKTIQKDLLFIDLRRPDSDAFVEMMATITLKLSGIVLQNAKSLKSRTVFWKTKKQPKPLKVKKIIHPPSECILKVRKTNICITKFSMTISESLRLPSLLELIVKENDEQFNDSRWALFQWLVNIGTESISKIKDSSDSKHIRLVRFTLKLLSEVRSNFYIFSPKKDLEMMNENVFK